MTDREIAVKIAEKVDALGGKTYFVGGYVRDEWMGIPGKDIDIEVHGIPPESLCAVLDSLGERTSMGKSFGVFGLKHYQIDIAMPRKEKAIGRGHKDFEVDIDPFIGEKAAASRRDFTMNAMMQNVLTGEVLDFFGGKEDIANRLVRHVSDVSFCEDALRVLRGAQFAARFRFTLAPETRVLCSKMELDAIAPERIMVELTKALLKADQPSVFFEELRQMDQLAVWFPELEECIGTQQDPIYHPEGDVWNHTMQVLDRAAGMQAEASYPLGLLMAAICHDLGKPLTSTRVGDRIHAIGHEKAGVPVANTFLRRLTNEDRLIKYVLNMVEMHMKPNGFVKEHAAPKKFMKMFDESVCPEDLLLLAAADRGEKSSPETGETLDSMLEAYYELKKLPPVSGADLLAQGVKPGPIVSEMMRYARKLWYAGLSHDVALRSTLSQFRGRY